MNATTIKRLEDDAVDPKKLNLPNGRVEIWEKYAYPCGLMAKSFFTGKLLLILLLITLDKFELNRKGDETKDPQNPNGPLIKDRKYNIIETGIAWETDKKDKFKK